MSKSPRTPRVSTTVEIMRAILASTECWQSRRLYSRVLVTQGRPPMPEPTPPDPLPEDAQVAQALRRSLAVLVALGLVAGGAVWWLTREPAREDRPARFASNGRMDSAAPPLVRFTDITRSAGITFRHINGAHGEKLLP